MSKAEVFQLIQQYQTIILHRHVRPDPDALGSQGGLGEIIRATFPEKNVYLVGDEDPSLTFLTSMDAIEDDVFEGALVIVCDTANQARVDDQRYTNAEKIIKIDHHPNVDPYGDVRWVDTEASSTSELIYEFYVSFKENGLEMTDEAARLIYAGIVGDTGRFLFPSATGKTFSYAAELVTYNFNRPALYDQLYNTEHEIARLKGYILQNFTVEESGLSTVKITQDILNEYNVTPLQTSAVVGTLGDVEGVLAWAIFVEEEDQIRVRLRSKGPVVNEIAAKYNGGGHPMASGASVKTWADTEKVAADLNTVCIQYKNN
ncbi:MULTISPECIES: DHH family phosphoesterase [Pontibacillus]|uniref:Bifunctional oligoribonuclease/PAP phosphatase NrnA n=1 Tax=Pontibacillus chungwhensis TaxID=265426 RepID=A0ABY8UUP2_9BACI|nr:MULTISPECIES: bifunctional oligoribonuclease/PAP phosphatase NrnA [Pontibacillus]MCD5323846.1 bifunctional oligoribonuclease/PAP phosphatase NrnA [Pontibacillus sp. HN14]WIF97207.1 bifunctional oligoribonuclease/PAP phosphatase NrnA [Pontibacillus chungwhensis]